MIVALPTSRGVLILLLTGGAVAVALINIGLATALAASSLAGLVLASFLMAQFSLYGLRLERRPNRDGSCNAEIELPLAIRNRTWWFRQATVLTEKCPFAPGGVLHTAVPPLAPQEELTLSRNLTAVKRGHYLLSAIRLAGGDPAGLFRRTRYFRLPGEVMIYPAITRLNGANLQFPGSGLPSHDGRPLGHSGQGQEFFGLRPYRPGDEIRFIHWKGTAAKGELMIREFEANTVDRITVVLDTFDHAVGRDPRENNLEFLISAAASLAVYLSEMYCQVYFFAADGDQNELLRLSGDASGLCRKLLETLMQLTPSQLPLPELLNEVLEAIPPGSVVYVLSLSAEAECQRNFELLLDQDCEIRWIWAPKLNFPIVDPDCPRILYPEKLQLPGHCAVKPRIVNYQTQLPELLKR